MCLLLWQVLSGNRSRTRLQALNASDPEGWAPGHGGSRGLYNYFWKLRGESCMVRTSLEGPEVPAGGGGDPGDDWIQSKVGCSVSVVDSDDNNSTAQWWRFECEIVDSPQASGVPEGVGGISGIGNSSSGRRGSRGAADSSSRRSGSSSSGDSGVASSGRRSSRVVADSSSRIGGSSRGGGGRNSRSGSFEGQGSQVKSRRPARMLWGQGWSRRHQQVHMVAAEVAQWVKAGAEEGAASARVMSQEDGAGEVAHSGEEAAGGGAASGQGRGKEDAAGDPAAAPAATSCAGGFSGPLLVVILERVQSGLLGAALSSMGITGLYITFVFGEWGGRE